MGVNMTLPAAFEDTLSTQEQIQWLYKYKEALLTAGANIQITRQGDTVVISAIGEGFSPTVEVEEIPGGHEVTITDGTGAHVFDVMDGVDGEDGVSPAVVITSITGGHRVVITDEDHPSGQSFDVMDGVDGTDGTSITVKSVTPVSGGVNLVITDSAGDHTIFLANGPQGLTGPQGPQGPTGATGAAGATGATPEITMTATSDGTYSATPTVTVVKGGTDLNPTFSLAFSGLRGQQGIQGETGATGAQGPQGPAGEDGEDGTNGNSIWNTSASGTYSEGIYTFNISDLEGRSDVEPAVGDVIIQDEVVSGVVYTVALQITEVGSTTVDSVYFANMTGAQGPQGETGATGAQGPQGPAGQDGAPGQDGADGVTPVISATATADATHSANPSVTVTKSGTDAAPSFAFAFSGLQGEQGPQGETGATGAQGPQGETGATGPQGPAGPAGEGVPAHTSSEAGKVLGVDANGDTEWQTPSSGLPAGGTTGQVVTKTANGAEWANVPTELPSGGSVGQVLTKNSSGCAWSNIPAQLPTSGTTGYVLTKTSSGNAWQAAPTELPSGGSTGQILTKTSSGVAWQTPSGSVSPQLFTDLYGGSMTGSSNANINLTTPPATRFKLLVDRIKVGDSEYSRIKPMGFVAFSTSGSTTVNWVTLTITRSGSYTWNGKSYNYNNYGDFPDFLQYSNACIVTSTDNAAVASRANVYVGMSKIEISVYPYKSVSANCAWTIYFG